MPRWGKSFICRGSFINFPWEGRENTLCVGGLGVVVYLAIIAKDQLTNNLKEHIQYNESQILLDPVGINFNVNDWVTKSGGNPKYILEEGEDSLFPLVEGIVRLGESNFYPLGEFDPETHIAKCWEATEDNLTDKGRSLLQMLKESYGENDYEFLLITALDS